MVAAMKRKFEANNNNNNNRQMELDMSDKDETQVVDAATMENLEAQLAVMRETAEALLRNQKELEAKVAKGTRDLTAQAQAVAAKDLTLEERIEARLRANFATTSELSRDLGVPVDKVQDSIKKLRPKIHNVDPGDDREVWSWRVGPDATTKELRQLVHRLINYKPMSFRQLVIATGADDGVVQGHIVELRKIFPVENHGSPGRGRWFLKPETARVARISTQPPNRKK